jgi:hypothetical protein
MASPLLWTNLRTRDMALTRMKSAPYEIVGYWDRRRGSGEVPLCIRNTYKLVAEDSETDFRVSLTYQILMLQRREGQYRIC